MPGVLSFQESGDVWGRGGMAGLFVHCEIMSSVQLQDTEMAVMGNISCQP